MKYGLHNFQKDASNELLKKMQSMRKSYEVLITVEVSLCNGEKVLTDSFSKVISDSQVK